MKKKKTKLALMIIIALAIVILMENINLTFLDVINGSLASIAQLVVFLFVVSSWGIYRIKTIMHQRIRIYFLASLIAMILLLVIQRLKFLCRYSDITEMYIWYIFFIPQLFMVLFAFLMALNVGKKEKPGIKIPGLIAFLVTLFLSAFIMTNNIHRLVFSFDGPISPDNYSNNFGYYIIMAWMIVMAVTVIVILAKQDASLRAGIPVLPFVVLAVAVAYTFINFGNSERMVITSSVMFCIVIIAIWESLIDLRLIPSNTYYSEIFENSALSMELFDEFDNSYKRTKNAKSYSHETLKRLKKEGMIQPDIGTIVRAKQTKGGYLVWSEDVYELSNINSELRGTYEETAQNVFALKSDIDVKAKMLRLEEQNRLYDMVSGKLKSQLEEIAALLEEIRAEKNAKETARLWKHVSVIGTYVKRQSNLMLMAEGKEIITIGELKRCFAESMENLKNLGMDSAILVNDELKFPPRVAGLFYELFEKMLEACLDELEGVYVTVRTREKSLIMSVQVNIKGQSDLSEIALWNKDLLAEIGAKLVFEREDESTYYASLSFFDRRKEERK